MTLEYLLKLDSGAFEGSLSKARSGMRGAKSDAMALDGSVVSMGKHGASGFAALGAGILIAGGGAAKSEGLFKRAFHAIEHGVGGTARVLRAGGGVTQIGAMFARQIPALSKYRDGLKAIEDRAHRMNSRLETLAGIGSHGNHAGGGMLAIFRGGQGGGQAGGPMMAQGGGGGGARAMGGIGLTGMLKGGMFAGALAGIMGGMKASSSAAMMESSEIAFKTLIGDATKAKATLKELFDFAADTPFQMPEVQSSAVKLMAAGVAAEDLSGSLSVLGNVTAGYQADLSAVATIYAQVVNKGKLYAEELQQFGENGVPALRLVADALGKTTAEVMAMGTAGELSAADLAKAFNKAGGAGGKLANAMQEQAASTKGLWSTLSDNINRLFIIIGRPINDALRPMLAQAISYAGKLAPALEASIGGFKAALDRGTLGKALSATLRFGMAEFSIFAAKSLASIAQGVGKLFSSFTVGDVDAAGSPLLKFFSGFGDILRAELGSAFTSATSDWIASMAVGMAKVKELFGGPKALSHDEYKKQLQEDGAGDADGLRQQGKDKIRGAFGNPLQDMADAMGGGAFASMWRAWADVTKEGVEKGAEAGKQGLSEAVEGAMSKAEKSKAKKGKDTDKDEPKKIMGFSYKKSGANAGFTGLEGYKKLQERHETSTTDPARAGYRRGAFVPTNNAFRDGAFKMPKEVKEAMEPAATAKSGSTAGAAPGTGMNRHMMNGLDQFYAKNPTQKPAPAAFAPKIKLPTPGTAKAEQGRREAAASEARGGGADEPKWDLVASINDKMGKLAPA